MLIELVEFLSLKIRKRGIKIDRRIPDGYLLKLVFFRKCAWPSMVSSSSGDVQSFLWEKCYRESPINDYSG